MLRRVYLTNVINLTNIIHNNINNTPNLSISTNITVPMDPVVRIINKITNSNDGNMKVYKLGA